jgi:hypothetical protein
MTNDPGGSVKATPLEADIVNFFKNHEEQFRKSLKELYAKTAKTVSVLSRSLPKEELEVLKRLRNRLEDPSILGDVTTYATYLNETYLVVKGFLDLAREIRKEPSSPEKLKKLEKINSVVSSYEDVFNDLFKDWAFVEDVNHAKKLINEITGGIKELRTIYAISVEQEVSLVLSKTLETQVSELENNLLKQKAFYEKRLKDYQTAAKKDLIGEQFVTKKIAEIDKLLSDKIYTKDIISDFLLGKRQDLGFLTQFVAPASIDDPVIVATVTMFNNALTELRSYFIPISGLYEIEFNRFLQTTGQKRGNNKDLYKDMITTIKVVKYNITEDKLEEKEYLGFLNKNSSEWYYILSKYDAEEEQARHKNDLDAVKRIKEEKKKFLYKHAEQPYTQAWYDDYKILDEAPDVYNEKGELVLKGALTQRDTILNSIKAINEKTVNDENDIQELDILWREFRMLASPVNEDGTDKVGHDLLVANTLRKFNKIHREKYRFELTDKGKENFDQEHLRIQSALKNGSITKEQYEVWKSHNVRTMISPEFYEKQRQIYNQINAILSKIPSDLMGKKVDIGDWWEIIKAITNNYRDENGVVDGTQVNAELAKKIKEQEEDLYDLKSNMTKLSGLSREQSIRLSNLYGKSDSKGLTEEEQMELDNLAALKKANKAKFGQFITEEEEKQINALYQELATIQTTDTTEYYAQAYNAAKAKWKAENPGKEDFLFERSEWFKNNHITKERFVWWESLGEGFWEEYDDPIYIWKSTKPTNPDYIIKDQPAFKYWERVVNEEYINKDFRESLTGLPNPKPMLADGTKNPYLSKEYEKLENSTNEKDKGTFRYLKFLTDRYLESQSKVPNQARLNYILPGVRKALYERVSETNNNLFTKIKDYFVSGTKEAFQLTEKDIDAGLANLKGEELLVVPVQFSTKIESNDVSLSITENVLKYEFSSAKYRYIKDNIEPVTNAILDTLESNKPITGKVDAVLKNLGINRFVKGSKDNVRLRIAKHIINSFVNNVKDDDILLGKISGTKFIGKLLGYNSWVMQALNIPVQLVNGISGNIQNWIEAAAGDDYDFNDINVAKREIYKNSHNFYHDRLKIGNKSLISQILIKFNITSEDLTNFMGAEADRSALKWWLKDTKVLTWVKDFTEFEVAATVGLAMLNKTKVKLNDKIIPLYKAFTKDAQGNIKLIDGVTKVDGTPWTDADTNFLMGKIQSKIRTLQGNYAKIDKTVLERNAIGKLIFFMRKYFIPLFIRRFGHKRFDIQSGKIMQGYYHRFITEIVKDLVIVRGNLFKYWELASDEDKKAVKLVIMDNLTIALISVLSWALLPGDDDDKELGFVMGNIAYVLLRIKTETETFHPFKGLDDMLRTVTSLSVATRGIDNIRKTLADFGRLISNDDSAYYKRDTGMFEAGTPKVIADLVKITGLPQQVYKIYDPEGTIKNFQTFVGR